MGQREGFSRVDLLKVNRLYQCDSQGGGSDGTDGEDENAIKPIFPKPTRRTTEEPTETSERPSMPGGRCTDSTWRCKFWSLFGYCNEERYQRDCPVSCGACGSRLVQGTTTRRPFVVTDATRPWNRRTTSGEQEEIPSSPSRCLDLNQHCSRWAASGQCTKSGFARYMAITCPMSCNQCTGSNGDSLSPSESTSDDCEDANSRCVLYASLGRCDRPGRVGNEMKRYCKKSCGQCQ